MCLLAQPLLQLREHLPSLTALADSAEHILQLGYVALFCLFGGGVQIPLLLVLIYLFRESEDDEWLIILALVLLMGLG